MQVFDELQYRKHLFWRIIQRELYDRSYGKVIYLTLTAVTTFARFMFHKVEKQFFPFILYIKRCGMAVSYQPEHGKL